MAIPVAKLLRRLLCGAGAVAVVAAAALAANFWWAAGPNSWNPDSIFTSKTLERFYALPELAKHAARSGNTREAEALSDELLALAPEFPNNWNYGNAVHDGHVVRGWVALERGDVGRAREELIAAGKSPGSPQLDTFGPTMFLAEALLEQGEVDAVIEYLDACGQFWEMDNGRLARWTETAHAGAMPEFGANLAH